MRTFLLGLLVALPSLALAQSAQDKAAAEALFREGRDLAKQGKYAEACAKFEGSQKLDPSAGTLLNLGDCYEKSGRTASAWATFEEAASSAKRVGDTRKAEEGKKRAGALEGKLPKLTIDVPAASRVSGLTVTRDGSAVPEVGWGTPVPVDPGKHVIKASAPGREDWTAEVEVAAGKAGKVEVPLLGEVPAGSGPGPGSGSGSDSGSGSGSGSRSGFVEEPGPGPGSPDEGSPGSGRRMLGMIVGGVGVVALGVGVYFGLSASSKWSDAEGMCTDGHTGCTMEAQSLADDAGSAADVSTILVGVGVAAVAGGVILYLTAPKATEQGTAVRFTPTGDGAAVLVEGRF